MNIVELNKIYIVGMKCRTNFKNNINLKLKQGFISRINEIKYKINPQKVYGICFYEDFKNISKDTEFTYMIGVEVKKNFETPPAMEFFEIKKTKFAKFEFKINYFDLYIGYKNILYEIKNNNLEIKNQEILEIHKDNIDIYIPIK